MHASPFLFLNQCGYLIFLRALLASFLTLLLVFLTTLFLAAGGHFLVHIHQGCSPIQDR